MNVIRFLSFSLLVSSLLAQAQQKPDNRPNILWIVSEDNSASYLHCYGNEMATTPNIDMVTVQP